MKNTVYDFLHQVLTIIGYADDKDLFINQFIALCVAETNEQISVDDSTKDALEKIFAKKVQQNFEDYIETILPTLTPPTKTKLLDFLESTESYFGLLQ